MSRTVLLLAAVTLLATAVNALYGKNSAVIALTPDNFREEVIESSHVWVVEFFAPWCGHCQRLAPDYEKAATNLKGLVKVGAVNCDEEKSKPLCGTYGVQGFPTIKIFPSELTPAGKRSDQLTKTPFDYQGERSARAIVDFALSQLPLYVKKIASKPGKRSLTLEDFLADQADKLSHVILFTSKTTTTPLFKALAVDFKDRLVLGEVASTDSEIISKYNVDKFPTLIVIPKEADAAPVTYSGALKHDEIFAFLEPFALPVEKKAKSSSSGSSSKKEAPPEEPFNPEVAFVQTQAELEKECLNKPIGTCIIAFLEFDPEYDRSVKEHQENIQVLRNLKQRAHDKKQAFHFLWVKASDQADLRNSFGISDIFPAVLAVSPSRNVFRPFVGGFDESVLSEFIDEYQIGRGGRFFKFTHAIKLNEQTPPSTAE